MLFCNIDKVMPMSSLLVQKQAGRLMVATLRAESRPRTGAGIKALETETETERKSAVGHSTGQCC